MTHDADVAIVGCGPVGSTLAILIAQLGHRVMVLERWPEPYPLPRAVHFDHEVARIFQSAGIGPALREIIEPADIYEWRNATGTTLLRFGRRGDGPSGWPFASMFNQPALEALLDERLEQLPTIEVRRGVEVDGLVQDADGVTLSTVGGPSVRARIVIGCDGANSTVRRLADLGVHDLGFFFDWLIVDVILDEPRVFDPLNQQICDPVRPTTAVSGGPGRRRWEFMRLPNETLDELNVEQRAWELLAPWDVHPGNARLERHAVYTFNARHAERWRDRRVVIAGDAAHQMPPFAGQGMCAGIRDAANLAWKLDLVLTGRAPDALLDTYEVERLPNARQAIEFSMQLGNVICVPDPVAAAARDEAMASAVGDEPAITPELPGIDVGIVSVDSPHAGRVFVQGSITGRHFDDVYGAGWRFVTTDADTTIDDDLAAWFASIGGLVVALPAPDDVHVGWFAGHDCTWALQRPDFHLFGTAIDRVTAEQLLVELRDCVVGSDRRR
ncbi:MAG: bifunctional 3-(3-hydroxy-phenyl)propionate/3-hydroxycinnamic acid hydroxylase [Ilumatobacteraceae bacterium]